MRSWIAETIRPISFLVAIPVFLGALLSGTHMDYHIVFAMLGGILASGFANAFNSLVDRRVDRLNPQKRTLAMKHPVAAWYGVLFLLPPLAFCLRYSQYHHVLLSLLFYLSFLYSYTFGNVPVVKRLAVAAVVASTVFLYAATFTWELWLLAGLTFAFIYYRESRKDRDDRQEDEMLKFAWRGKLKLDWWCVVAPLLGAAIYLLCFPLVDSRISAAEAAVALGIMISVWAYIQIRYKYRHYRMRMLHRTSGGRLGVVIAMVGLMPSFVNPLFVMLVTANSASILYRSYLGRLLFQRVAIAHDALLWASLPLLVMTKVGYNPLLVVAAALLAIITCANMSIRRHHTMVPA